jgi:glycosyltransferase involved in cell wall biosynthesis
VTDKRQTVHLVEWVGNGGLARYAVDVANRIKTAHRSVIAGTTHGPASGCQVPATVWFDRRRPGRRGDLFAAATGLLSCMRLPRRGDVAWIPLGIAPAYELSLVTALKARGVRVIGTVHNRDPSHGPEAGRAARVAVRSLNLAIAHTDELAGWLESEGVTPHRLPFPPPQPPDVLIGTHDRRSLGLPGEDKTLIGIVGRLVPYKGLDILIDAFSMATAAGETSDKHLLIAGEAFDGVDAHALLGASRIPEAQVTVLDRYLSDDELISVLDTLDALVLPYRQIDNSGVAALAGLRGVPAIVSDLTTLRDTFGPTTPTFPPGSVAALSKLLGAAKPRPAPFAPSTLGTADDAEAYIDAVRLASAPR